MSEFVRVLGDDPWYKGRKTFMHIAVHSVQKICPMYAVKDEHGQYYRCTAEHEAAEVVSYQLTDFSGSTYWCGNPKELEKLGIMEPPPKRQLGFVSEEDGEKREVDMRDALP